MQGYGLQLFQIKLPRCRRSSTPSTLIAEALNFESSMIFPLSSGVVTKIDPFERPHLVIFFPALFGEWESSWPITQPPCIHSTCELYHYHHHCRSILKFGGYLNTGLQNARVAENSAVSIYSSAIQLKMWRKFRKKVTSQCDSAFLKILAHSDTHGNIKSCSVVILNCSEFRTERFY